VVRLSASLLQLVSVTGAYLWLVCFLLGNSPASEFYIGTLFHLHRQVGVNLSLHLPPYEEGTDRKLCLHFRTDYIVRNSELVMHVLSIRFGLDSELSVHFWLVTFVLTHNYLCNFKKI
jgi:hypothetical protein